MGFLRIWLGLYLSVLVVSISLRMQSYHVVGWETALFSWLTLFASLVGWIFLEKKNTYGVWILLVMSGLRIFVIFLIATVLFGFVIAYIPTGQVWAKALTLSNDVLWLLCALAFCGEFFFFVKLKNLNLIKG